MKGKEYNELVGCCDIVLGDNNINKEKFTVCLQPGPKGT